MATPVHKIKGVTPELAAKFDTIGIRNTDQLLDAGCSPDLRKNLAAKTGTDVKILLEVLNRADLARIKGIGDVYANLLEQAGVDTVKELAARVPGNLHAKIVAENEKSKLTHHVPKLEDVEAWVTEAKALPKLLTY